MGINTVAVLFNDMSHEIRTRDDVGKRMADAMTSGWSLRNREPLACDFRGGRVISQAHADYSQVVVVGRNHGKMLAECDDLDSFALNQMADALQRHGWTVKAPSRLSMTGAPETWQVTASCSGM